MVESRRSIRTPGRGEDWGARVANYLTVLPSLEPEIFWTVTNPSCNCGRKFTSPGITGRRENFAKPPGRKCGPSPVRAPLPKENWMTGKCIVLGTPLLLAVMAALPASAQQPSLEDRVRALEQMLGIPSADQNQPLEQRVKALEDAIAQQNAQKEEDDQLVRT